MLEANGLAGVQRFMIAETVVTDGRLPGEVYGPVRKWLEETAVLHQRRGAGFNHPMSARPRPLPPRGPLLAKQLAAQVAMPAEPPGTGLSSYCPPRPHPPRV